MAKFRSGNIEFDLDALSASMDTDKLEKVQSEGQFKLLLMYSIACSLSQLTDMMQKAYDKANANS